MSYLIGFGFDAISLQINLLFDASFLENMMATPDAEVNIDLRLTLVPFVVHVYHMRYSWPA